VVDRSDPITADDLASTLAAQGSELEVGDVLLVRTGWMAWYRSLGPADRAELASSDISATGLAAGRAMAAFLWDHHVAAVAADNPALECWPPPLAALDKPARRAAEVHPSEAVETFLHAGLLPLLGVPIGELFDLDALAQDCADDGRYEALFTSAPLNLAAGVASPPNALAVK
jgi:kynurenine formamidase